MKFHISSGSDYYSEEYPSQRDKALLGVIKQSINTFNWAGYDIKDEKAREALAIFISDGISRWRLLDCP